MNLNITTKKSRKEGQVILRYAYTNGTRVFYSTGIGILITDFQERVEKPVRGSNPNAAHLNRLAEQIYRKIMGLIDQLYREKRSVNAALVHELYYRKEEQVVQRKIDSTLSASFERMIQTDTKNNESTRKIYRRL